MSFNLESAFPLIAICSLGMILLILEIVLKQTNSVSYAVSIGGLIAVGILIFPGVMWNGTGSTAPGLGLLFCEMFITAALLTVVFSRGYLRRHDTEQAAGHGSYYLLVIFAVAGMMLMALAEDLITLFLGLELMSICLYVLVGFLRRHVSGNEASLKYFLLGAFITGFVLYGIALIYGSSGTLSIDTIVTLIQKGGQSLIFWAGLTFVLAGFAFKVGAFPFHMWIPDVYQGAPTPITAFMATGAKAAAFSVLILIFSRRGGGEDLLFRDMLSVLAAGSMIAGNLLAIMQQNVKRMLAYSSIAHAGYMLVGIASGNLNGSEGVTFYLVSYLFMNVGAFGIVSLVEEKEEQKLTYDDYAGFSAKNPLLAGLLALFLFSLAGLPPFGGFFGKYFVFVAAIEADLTWLAILGVLSSLAGVYYYIRLVMVMYFQDGEGTRSEVVPRMAIAALGLAALVNIQLGILPSTVISLIHRFQ